ncbi:MAG: TraX family protein [Eubacteriales bacterium]|nr:TraX family protein [Eubacteriales bacterium]
MTTRLRGNDALAGNLDTGLLKILALVFMFVDHTGAILFHNLTEMRVIGRLALPLYMWCIVVGCERTHDIGKYAFRLLLLAIVSQPINMIALDNPWTRLNVLFVLFLGVCCIAAFQSRQYYSQFWVPLLCYVFLGFVNVDYGWKGLTFLLLLYAARKTTAGLAATYTAFALFWGSSSGMFNTLFGLPLTLLSWPGVGPVLQAFFRMQGMVIFALPLILIPMHSGLRMPRWLGYAFYPLHLVIILIIRLLMGVPLSAMLSGVLTLPW